MSLPRSAVAAPPRPGATPAAPQRRLELDGLRAVAALVVVAYHVSPERVVSGGVDVFLLLTGFFITGTLVRMVDRDGVVDFGRFYSRLARRLLPPLALTLAAILVMTLVWLPQTEWLRTLREIVASGLYFENWRLAFSSVDYLGTGSLPSALQHAWSLGVQGQFYILWPLLISLCALIAARTTWRARRLFFFVNAAVFAVSFAYSLWQTVASPAWAYFDTGTRLWELALGGMLAIAVHRIRLAPAVRLALGWIGVLGLILCGLLTKDWASFPGYASLWPVGCAIAVILAGSTGSRAGADRFLTLRPVTYLGGISYALYLWHWPIMICYLAVTDRTAPSLKGAAFIVVVSLAVAAVTSKLVDGMAVPRLASTGFIRSMAVGMACILPVVAVAAVWKDRLYEEMRRPLVLDPATHPGATAPEGWRPPPGVALLPEPARASEEQALLYDDGCHQDVGLDEVLDCSYGADEESARLTVALVGSSHAAHWFPALNAVAERNRWRIVPMTKSACRMDQQSNAADPSCGRWQRSVMEELRELRPDVVVTPATVSSRRGSKERLPPGFVRFWSELDAIGVKVLGIRDTPSLGFLPPRCIERRSPGQCRERPWGSLADRPPYERLNPQPANVTFTDFTERLCPDRLCRSVLGNVLVYSDYSHFTTTFMTTMAPYVEREVRRAAS